MFAGAVMGAVAGMVAAAIFIAIMAGPEAILGPLPFVGAAFGIILGSMLAPLAGFTFLRHVPLWRLFADVTAGTIAGGVLSALVYPNPNFVLSAAIAGFILAGIRVAKQFRPRHVLEPAPPS